MRPLRKSRSYYLFATMLLLSVSIFSIVMPYYMIKEYMDHQDIFYYSRSDSACAFASIVFIILTVSSARCFIRNRPNEYNFSIKIDKMIRYYGIFFIIMIPVSNFLVSYKLKNDGYIVCRSQLHSTVYSKTEKICEDYKNNNNYRN